MISRDSRIGKGYDFDAGGTYTDLSFEKERTLLVVFILLCYERRPSTLFAHASSPRVTCLIIGAKRSKVPTCLSF